MRAMKRWRRLVAFTGLLLMLASPRPGLTADSFRFVVLGDRTGEAQPGVYEQVWSEASKENPAFVLSVGDTIEGLRDETADAEWRQVEQLLKPFQRYPLYLAPGNHDVWSQASERAFRQRAGCTTASTMAPRISRSWTIAGPSSSQPRSWPSSKRT